MMAKIILTKAVDKLGRTGDIVDVKAGYARNFLIPNGLAQKWSEGAEKHVKLLASSQVAKLENDLSAAKDVADSLQSFGEIAIEVKTTKTGKLYGSVSANKILDAIYESTKIKLDSKSLKSHDHIKEAGTHSVEVQLHPDVKVDVKLKIVPNSGK
ncbi:MAG: 50S ribosomal protein L9 [Bifidobacteriaceae bacterium]|jgi:large subunit ribosomal protein L9|nr:50S ribosomal protein L9 [Bifidobacteriaceae bacterium]